MNLSQAKSQCIRQMIMNRLLPVMIRLHPVMMVMIRP
jgi:hypothetical protein